MTKTTTSNNPDTASSLPLVSIICRTMLRPELTEALESVANQTYSNLEVILVNATGSGSVQIPEHLERLNIVQVGDEKMLARPLAANLGLDSASGEYLIFLDDDDWISADHISSLFEVLTANGTLAAYSDTQRVDASGALREELFARDFDLAVLMRDNFLPIHSVLFSAELLKLGCRFDPSLHIYEDWDFWLQVSKFTNFSHVKKVTAFYRDGGRSGTEVSAEMDKYQPDHPNALAREKVIGKWISRWNGADINRMLGSMVRYDVIEDLEKNLDLFKQANTNQRDEIVGLKQHAEQQKESITSLEEIARKTKEDLQNTTSLLDSVTQKSKFIEQELNETNLRIRELEHQNAKLSDQYGKLQTALEEVLNSFSWRVMRPYRYLSLRFKRFFLIPIRTLVPKTDPAREAFATDSVKQETLVNKVGVKIATKRDIKYSLDAPASDNELVSDSLFLHGWAFSRTGPVEVYVSVDGQEYLHFIPSLSRLDVSSQFPRLVFAGQSGFSERLSLRYLPSGKHRIQLRIKSDAGAELEVERTFFSYDQEELYNAWLSHKAHVYKAEELVSDSEVEQAHLYMLFVAGSETSANLRSLESLSRQEHIKLRLIFVGENWEMLSSALDDRATEVLEAGNLIFGSVSDALHHVSAQTGWVGTLAPGCVLSPFALKRMLDKVTESEAGLIYCDHDTIDERERHSDPVFTFGWSPEHLISSNYVGSVFLASVELLVRHVAKQNVDNWSYYFLLSVGFSGSKAVRLPEMLWSKLPLKSDEVDRELISEQAAIQQVLSDNAIPAKLQSSNGVRSLDWLLNEGTEKAQISIIIPTTGKLQLVRPCIESLLTNTSYPNYEVIILDNSRGKNPDGIEWLKAQGLNVIECDEAFNWSRLNNNGARIASGELLLFLNDDIEIPQADWLEQLASQALRPEVGAVGCKLLYPNGALQHAGVILVNHGGGCAHLFHKMMPNHHIYQRLDKRVRETSAVTGACLMVKRALFDELKGFDEELAVVGNDIDFCLRLADRGLRNIWTPRCELVHHESISRESTVPPKDEQAMWQRWGEQFTSGDYYYNPNLSQNFWDCRQKFDVPPAELLARLEASQSGDDEVVSGAVHEQSYVEGVNLIGYIRADMGVGEGARSDARALEAAGVDFGIINFESGNPASMTNMQWQSKEILNAPFDINLIHVNGNFLQTVIDELPAHFIQGRYNIAYWAWELEELPTDWIPALELVDEIWAPSEFVKTAIERVSKIPVVTIPHNTALAPSYAFPRSHFGISEDSFVFLSMYDTNSIAERKNPKAALSAFQSAFAGDDESVCLVLKLNNATDESVAELVDNISGYSNIVIVRGFHNRQEIDSLLTQIDCFVSLHRSEGFGLGPLEAMSLGKPCILTNWSGNTEYMSDDNCLPVDYELITIERDFGPYNAGQRWADADVDQAAAHMRKLARDPAFAESIGQQAKRSVEANFSPRAVGQLVAERLASIRQSRQ